MQNPIDVRALVAAAIARVGVQRTANILGVERETALRIAVPGARVQRGTLALAQQRAAELEAAVA
jgi:hypothetical protein